MSESRVKFLKSSMDHMFTSGASSLNFNEFSSLLAKCACVINERPLGVRHHNSAVNELVPLTPNLLLLGRAGSSPPDVARLDDGDNRFKMRKNFIDEIFTLWWDMWFRQAFDSLFPLPKWKERMPNLSPGDVCLLKYERKVGKGDFRLCKVVEVHPDEKGLVRTVTVAFRPTSSKEKSLPYTSKELKEMKVGLNRLVLICPADKVFSDQ